MKLPAGHARRLFLGFICSVSCLVLFAVLVAYNTDAQSSNQASDARKEASLAISIPASKPEETIAFYQKLGFKSVAGLNGPLDVISMERKGTPYKLEICHNRLSEAGPIEGGVSSMSFVVSDLAAKINELQRVGVSVSDTGVKDDGCRYASLSDPNGIRIKLLER
jgi:predicted enzyme related to lactoylglutathione lyase